MVKHIINNIFLIAKRQRLIITFIGCLAIGLIVLDSTSYYLKNNDSQLTFQNKPNTQANQYKQYYFGLVYDPRGILINSYNDYIVLINNKNAVNPSYQQLMSFLLSDTTDQYLYKNIHNPPKSFLGKPENQIDIDAIKDIIDGNIVPKNPRICSDFAERLHNNAEMAGIRCGFVGIELSDISFGHALVVFETWDRGLIYVDSTGSITGYGPENRDAVVDTLRVGQSYNPRYLFPSEGWNIPENQYGHVTDIYITWEGDWEN
jgi:hypothetical protein